MNRPGEWERVLVAAESPQCTAKVDGYGYDQRMSFGHDLDYESFTRAFAAHDIRPHLGLEVDNGAAEKIAADDGLMRNVYAQWQRAHPAPIPAPVAPRAGAVPPFHAQARAPSPPSPRVSAPATAPRVGSTPLTERPTEETGFWPAIVAGLLVVAAPVAVAIGFFLADDRRVGTGLIRRYGRESYNTAGDSLLAAAFFLAIALVLSCVAIARGRKTRRPFPLWAGITAIILIVFGTIVLILNAVRISTWI